MSGAAGVLHYRISHLEMTARPTWGWPPMPAGREGALLLAEAPPAWFYLALHEAVGRDFAWETPFGGDPAAIDAWLADPGVTLWTLMRMGWPNGFFLIDARSMPTVRIAQWGLVPEARGRGWGEFLVRTAVLTAWSLPGAERLAVSVTSLDHPRALALYQQCGFVVTAQQAATRVLPAP